MRSGKWRFKPSGKLPIFMRYIINSAFTKEIAKNQIFTILCPTGPMLIILCFGRRQSIIYLKMKLLGILKPTMAGMKNIVKGS